MSADLKSNTAKYFKGDWSKAPAADVQKLEALPIEVPVDVTKEPGFTKHVKDEVKIVYDAEGNVIGYKIFGHFE